jgi:oxygen-independent coproporphyrinogen-3 oxidase
MHLYLPDLARRSVPRYTSYPTAAEFGDGVGAAEQARALEAIAPGAPVSLYVHIPYCREICWYCGCNTGALGRGTRLAPYLAALAREIDRVAERTRGEVVSIHFGGGSPNVLAPAEFEALVRHLRDRFACAADVELAVELDPRGFDHAYADALARAGVRRVSLGAQTFALAVQQRINRIQPFAMIAQAVADLRAAGIDHVNLDLMYGLPGQCEADVAETIDRALYLAPDRVAMFGYAHMPRLLPRQRMIEDTALPDAEARFHQSALAFELLVGAGYRAIGFDHFALPSDSLAQAADAGRLRRNFQGFTDERAEAIIGLGASSISQFDGLLVQNEKHVGRYRERAATGLAGARGVLRSADDRLRAALIERLLCDGTVDIARIAAAHDVAPALFQPVLGALQALARRRVVKLEGWRVTVTAIGRPYARLAAAAFDGYRAGAIGQFSRAV